MRSQSLIGPLVGDIHSKIEIIESDKTAGYAIEFMKKHGYDQVPVSNKQKTKNLGSITSVLLVQKFSTSNFLERNVTEVMGDPFRSLDVTESAWFVLNLLETEQCVLTVEKNEIKGMINWSTIIKKANNDEPLATYLSNYFRDKFHIEIRAPQNQQ